jgi:hypothetical protein
MWKEILQFLDSKVAKWRIFVHLRWGVVDRM